jgi:hypothetical protein
MKSSIRWDMLAVHLLSIPTGSESVSNLMRLAASPAWTDIAMADKAKNARSLECLVEALRLRYRQLQQRLDERRNRRQRRNRRRTLLFRPTYLRLLLVAEIWELKRL